jgi:predicted HD phosphohydrolase
MCQAAMIAEEDEADEEMVLAAFLHYIGHLFEFIQPVTSMSGVGVEDHEKLAEDYLLEKGFSSRVSKLVKSHVDAKRYLTFR